MMAKQLIFALLSTAAFCILWHLPLRHLLLASFGGMAGCALSLFLGTHMQSTFYAGLLVSIFSASYAEIAARRVRAPATLFLIPAIIPLVPGSSLYYTMLSLVQGDTAGLHEYGLQTVRWVVSLAAGISLVGVVHQILHRPKKAQQS